MRTKRRIPHVQWSSVQDHLCGFKASIGESLARCVTKPSSSSALILWSLEEEEHVFATERLLPPSLVKQMPLPLPFAFFNAMKKKKMHQAGIQANRRPLQLYTSRRHCHHFSHATPTRSLTENG